MASPSASYAKRPAHLLSGLVTCGAYGSPVLATGASRWRCKGHRAGTCGNGSITTVELESRALAGIRDKLLTPEIIGQFAAALQHELEDAHRSGHDERIRAEHELAETRARIAKLVTSIKEDEDAPRSLSLRLRELEAVEQRLEAALSAVLERPVVRLPANYEALYRRAVADLDEHLASGDGAAALEALRGLIEKVAVQPGSARGGKRRPMQLHGAPYRMREFAEGMAAGGERGDPNAQQPRLLRDGAVETSLVAGTGFEPVTFRL